MVYTYSIANVDIDALLQQADDLLNLASARRTEERRAGVRLGTIQIQPLLINNAITPTVNAMGVLRFLGFSEISLQES